MVLFSALLTSCWEESISVTGVSISLESNPLVLQKGETKTLTAVIAPENATNRSVRWMSSDDSVLSVDVLGQASALSPGTAEVVVTTIDGGFTAGCKVIVEQHASGLTLSETALTIKELESVILKATFNPADAVDALVWESSDPETAVVEYGIVRGLRANPEPVTITARTEDSSLSATCQVTVICDVKGVSLKESKLQLLVGEQYKLEHVVYPTRATNQNVTWVSDNPDVVSVSEGNLVAVKKGKATITVTTEESGFSASCSVEVVNSISGMSITPDILSLTEDETAQLEVVFDPPVSGEQIKWSSSDEEVATVSEAGLVKAIGAGDAVIFATIESGLLAYCNVNVSKMVNSMRLDPEAMVLLLEKFRANESQQRVFRPVTDPEGANLKLIWSSSDDAVATVSSSGELTPVSPGTAVITASTSNENPAKRVTASGSVTVIQEVTSIEGVPESLQMWEGETKDIALSFVPENASTNYRVQYDESGDAELSFDKNTNKLSASAPGTRTMHIIPSFTYPQGLQKSCYVIVLAHVHELKAKESLDVKMPLGGETLSLKDQVVFVPSDAANQKLSWTSGDTSIATVDEDGVVTGVKAGSVEITAVADDAYMNAKLVFKLKVVEKDVKEIKLEPLTLDEGSSKTVVYTIEPEGAYDSTLTWESSKPFVASVDQDGVVTGVKAGTAVITATAKSGVSATCGVTVTSKVVHVTNVTLSRTSLSLDVGEEGTLVAQVLPDNAANRKLVWTVEPEDSKVVSLTPGASSCSVEALAVGEVTVKATSEDGGISATCIVKVTKALVHVTSLTLDISETTLAYGTSQTLTATVLPANADDKSVTWTVDDESIATVDENGVVTAKSKTGETTVHAVSNDNSYYSASCVVKVVPKLVHVTGVSIQTEDGQDKMTISVGQVKRVIAVVTPNDATNKAVIWSTQAGGVVFVSQDGYVTANQAGITRVVVNTVDGGYNASMQVKVVENKPASIQISQTSLIMKVGETFDLTATVIGEDPSLPPTYSGVIWKSSDTSVANPIGGHVRALAEGTATITVESEKEEYSHITATCQLTVIGGTPNGGSEGIDFDDWNY